MEDSALGKQCDRNGGNEVQLFRLKSGDVSGIISVETDSGILNERFE